MYRRRAGFWWAAFAIGAAIGGVTGLLLAPRRGKETREMLRENLGRGGAPAQFRKRADELLATGRATPSDLISRTQRQLDELRSQAASRAEGARLRGQILRKQAELRYLQGKERLRSMR